MKELLKNIFIFNIILFIVYSAHATKNTQEKEEETSQTTGTIAPKKKEVLEQAQSLLLDDFLKLMRAGRSSEAIELEKQKLQKYLNYNGSSLAERYRLNNSLLFKPFDTSYLTPTLRFQPFRFQFYPLNLDVWAESFKNNIKKLQKGQADRENMVRELEQEMCIFSESLEQLSTQQKNVDEKRAAVKSIKERRKLKEQSESFQRQIKEKQDKIDLLKSLHETTEIFNQDTLVKVEQEEKKISFIQTYKDFFVIKPGERSHILGINETNLPNKQGDGIIVGIIDNFPEDIQSDNIRAKLVNPNFKGTEKPEIPGDLDNEDRKSHGLHVAGIIASDLWGEKKDMPIGIAPNARLELVDSYHDLKKVISLPVIENKDFQFFNSDGTHNVGEFVRAMDSFAQGEGYFNKLFNFYNDNPLFKSKIKVINVSLDMDSICNESIFGIFNSIRKGSLLVAAAGNKGWDLSTTSSFAILKAFSRNDYSKKNFIMVTNLREDGKTLHSMSNIPGEDEDLQNCTLSALGTNIESIVLKDNENDLGYKPLTGTSMAAPHVSGVATLVASEFPTFNAAQLSKSLLRGATPLIINEEGDIFELSSLTTGELIRKLARAPSVFSDGITVTRQMWKNSKKLFGQGRVNHKGALKRAALISQEDPHDPQSTVNYYSSTPFQLKKFPLVLAENNS